MAKKKKSKVLPLIVLGIAIAVLFIVYKAVDSTTPTPGSDTTSASQNVTMILARDAATVSTLEVTYAGETLRFKNTGGTWSMIDAPNFPLDQTIVTQMAAAISQIGVYRTLETGDTGEFGLDTPQAAVAVTFEDGASYRYTVGDANPLSGNLYFKDENTGEVHMVASALLPYLAYTEEQLFVYDTLPTDIEAAHIESVTLTRDGTEAVFTEAEQMTALYGVISRFAPSEYADFSSSEEALEKYGIGSTLLTISHKKSVTVTDTSGGQNSMRIPATYKLRFGTVNAEGKIAYTVGESGIVYLADAAIFDTLAAYFK